MAPAALINTSHAASLVTNDLVILHPELNFPTALAAIDFTCGSTTTPSACSTNTLFDGNIVADSQNTSLANMNVATSQYPVNHAPYILVNNSFTSYSLTSWDLPNYVAAQAQGVLMSWAFVQPLSVGTAPPLVSTTVTATSGPASQAGANWGLEFGIANNYKGFNTAAPSWVTAAMTAVLAAMKVDHPSWNWFDIKAALRQTASNWASGWDPAQFGYGAIDYDAAAALPSTAALYLQPPILRLSASPERITATLYPFRSARRAYEVVYLVPGDYAFPMKNELTASDIASLTSAGGQLVFTGNRTDPTPSGTVSYTLSNPDLSYALVAFTTDGAGAYSRVEAWCPVSVGGPRGIQDAPLPMWAYAVLAVALLGSAQRHWSRSPVL